MPDEQKKYPKVTVGTIIINEAGKVFLMRHETKFKGQFYIPGGHVEWGESLEDCLKREVKEETGLNVTDPEFIRPVEFILSETYDRSRHIIPLDYAVKTSDPETSVRLDGREGSEYVWLTEDEVAKHGNIEATTKETIQIYFAKQKEAKQSVEYKFSWQRALADYRNLQKETAARRAEWAQMSEQQILEEFIPVYDNFKKAFSLKPTAEDKQVQSWIQGIGFIMQYFAGVLKSHKIEEIKTVGQMLDTKLHESIGEEESDKPHGTILKEAEGGYTMSGRVIKVAKVIISK